MTGNLSAQHSPTTPQTDPAPKKATNAFDSLLIKEIEFSNWIDKYPATDFLRLTPAPAEFRKKLLDFIPTGLLKMGEIVATHKEDDEDTVYNYPLDKPVLPGTYNNQYEYLTDGMLQFDAGLSAYIDSAVNESTATKTVAEWKALLQQAFPEDAAEMKDETNSSGNQFIRVKHPRHMSINKDKTGYSTTPGWTLTLQHFISHSKHDVCLMLMPLK